MPSYVAFLRAINLGAKRKFPKDAIRQAVEGAGCTEVETYINTGNVRLTTPLRSRAKVEALLEDTFLADRGFEVPTIAYTCAELARVAADIDEVGALRSDLERHYLLMLKDAPAADVVTEIEAAATPANTTVIRNRVAHLLLGPGYQAGGVDPLGVEKRLGVATNRNHTVIRAIAEKWC
jgi:uncharacterized protein (DUF1697 family)